VERSGALGRVLPFVPVAVLMVVIFSASSLEDPRLSNVALIDLAVKKTGHFALFLVLAFALALALEGSLSDTRFAGWALRLAFGVAILFAMSDELHQAFTPTRDPSLVDIGIDSLGAGAGLLVWRQVARWWAQRRSSGPVKSRQ
jgi:VanZ family protein